MWEAWFDFIISVILNSEKYFSLYLPSIFLQSEQYISLKCMTMKLRQQYFKLSQNSTGESPA